MARSENITPKGSRFVVLASMCIVVAALYFAQAVLIPLALAMLFCFLLAPVVVKLERWRVPRGPAVLLVVATVFALIVALGWVVTVQVLNLAERLPDYEKNIVRKVERFKGRFAGGEGGLGDKLEHAAREIEQATTRPASQPASSGPAGQAATAPATASSTAPSTSGGDIAAGSDPHAAPPASAPATAFEQVVRNPIRAAAREVMDEPADPAPPLGTSKANPVWTVALPAPVSPIKTLGAHLGVVLSQLGTLGLVIVFVIFMLLQREDLRDRMIRLVGRGDMNVTTTALDDAATRISRYMMAQAIVNGTYGVAVAIGLWLIGYFTGGSPFPSFVLWGLLCAVLRFIPYIGPWIAAAFPIVLSLAVYEGFAPFVWTTAMFVVIELLSNNLMEPWLYGASTGMSTVAVLVSAVFWTWLWGAVGLLLATPLTVCLVVMGKYVPRLAFLDIMLGDEPVLDPPERIYQRLLAGDQEEATEVARELLKEGILLDVYDDVLLPALSLGEQDRHRGRLDEQRQKFIRRAMRDIVEELGDEWRLRQDRTSADAMKAAAAATVEAAKGSDGVVSSAGGNGAPRTTPALTARLIGLRGANSADNPNVDGTGASGTGASGTVAAGRDPLATQVRIPRGCTVNVVCLPADDEADDVAGIMLAQLLEFQGYCAVAVSVTKLAGEMMEAVEKHNAHAVVVSALPPAAVAHSRYLCKRLHARFPELRMVVGLWTTKNDLKKVKDRVTCEGTVQLVSKLAQAMEQLGQMAQPVIVAAEERRRRAEAAE